MAGKNITIAGATFNAVPSIDVPISGGGTASFVEISDTTAAAADVASGKYFYTAAGVKTEGTASGGVDVEPLSVTQNGTYTAPSGKAYNPVTVNVSGGGGASNIVTGTFKGTTPGAAMDINLPYTGSGHPIGIIIFPTDGFTSGDPAYDLIQRYAVMHFCGVKLDQDAPTYESSGDNNRAAVQGTYKNSATSATTMAGGASRNTIFFSGADASAGNFPYNSVKFKSATKMSVMIASTSYGFAANIEYTYYVIYSE